MTDFSFLCPFVPGSEKSTDEIFVPVGTVKNSRKTVKTTKMTIGVPNLLHWTALSATWKLTTLLANSWPPSDCLQRLWFDKYYYYYYMKSYTKYINYSVLSTQRALQIVMYVCMYVCMYVYQDCTKYQQCTNHQHEAQLSQRGRAMPRVVEYFG